MKIRRSLFFLVVCTMFLWACGPGELNSIEFKKWVENSDNELLQIKDLNGVNYALQLKPLAYIIEQERVPIGEETARTEELKDMIYFNLTLQPTKKGAGSLLKSRVASKSEHQQALYYLSFNFQDQIVMLEGEDTLRCELFHFVRDHGLSPELRFALGFKESGKSMDRTVVINDELFNNGLIKFRYDEDLLSSIPNLK